MAASAPSTRNQLIDILRGFAILGVIYIHFTSNLPVSTYYRPFWSVFLVLFNQLSRLSVPFFVALSGYGLGKKYQSEPFRLKDFFFTRSLSIVPLYVFWALVIVAIARLNPAWSSSIPSLTLNHLILGKIDYHLYYIPMLLSLYLLFPLLLWWYRRRPNQVLATSLAVQSVWYLLIGYGLRYPGAIPLHLTDQSEYLLFFSWIFYFVIGLHLANRLLARRYIWYTASLVITGFTLSLVTALRYLATPIDVIVTTRFTRLPILVFNSTLLAFVLSFPSWVNQLSFPLTRLFSWLGSHSYVIYLSHTLWLRLFFSVIRGELTFSQSLGFSILLVLATYASSLLSGTITPLRRFLKVRSQTNS